MTPIARNLLEYCHECNIAIETGVGAAMSRLFRVHCIEGVQGFLFNFAR